jgi:predicted dehydrogenase
MVHAEAYPKVAAIELAAVCDTDFEKVRKFKGHKGLKKIKSERSVIKDPDIDVLDICAPTHVHKKLIIQGLRAGKHIFCEKPFARSVADAKQILQEARKGKKKVMVGYVCRFQDVNQKIKRMLEDGLVGSAGMVRSSRCLPFPGGWYGDYAKSGGVIFATAMHDIDLLRWFFGDIKRVYARGFLGSEGGPADYALISLRFASGAIGHIEASWAEVSTGYNAMEIAGHDGLIHYDSRSSAALTVSTRAGAHGSDTPVLTSPVHIEPIEKQIYHLLQCLESDVPPAVGVEDAFKNIQVAEAATTSIKTGRAVTLR